MNAEYKDEVKEINSTVDRTNNLYVRWSKMRGENYYTASILYIIYASDVHRQKEIVENYGIPKQTVNQVIAGLVRKGDVILKTDENDRRSKLIELTEQGNKYARAVVDPLMECEQKALKRMGKEKVSLFTDGLNEYAEYLEEEMKKSIKEKNNKKVKLQDPLQ